MGKRKSNQLSDKQKSVIYFLKEGYVLRKYGGAYMLGRNITHPSYDRISKATVNSLVKKKMIEADSSGVTFKLRK